MAELDIVRAWVGTCWWGSKKRYPDKATFLAAVRKDMNGDDDWPDMPLSKADVTETRLRHCVGGWCGEGTPHWHPTEKARGAAPVWQYGKEEP